MKRERGLPHFDFNFGAKIYLCRICRTHITSHVHYKRQCSVKAADDGFVQGGLFTNALNVYPKSESHLDPHTTQDIFCEKCHERLGWKFVEVSQQAEVDYVDNGDFLLNMDKFKIELPPQVTFNDGREGEQAAWQLVQNQEHVGQHQREQASRQDQHHFDGAEGEQTAGRDQGHLVDLYNAFQDDSKDAEGEQAAGPDQHHFDSAVREQTAGQDQHHFDSAEREQTAGQDQDHLADDDFINDLPRYFDDDDIN